jgi:hypothetical protein
VFSDAVLELGLSKAVTEKKILSAYCVQKPNLLVFCWLLLRIEWDGMD